MVNKLNIIVDDMHVTIESAKETNNKDLLGRAIEALIHTYEKLYESKTKEEDKNHVF